MCNCIWFVATTIAVRRSSLRNNNVNNNSIIVPILQTWRICVWYICIDDIWGAPQATIVMVEMQHSTRCPGDDLWWAWRSTLNRHTMYGDAMMAPIPQTWHICVWYTCVDDDCTTLQVSIVVKEMHTQRGVPMRCGWPRGYLSTAISCMVTPLLPQILQIWCICVWYTCVDEVWRAPQQWIVMVALL